jgi:hypothetical protein
MLRMFLFVFHMRRSYAICGRPKGLGSLLLAGLRERDTIVATSH